MTDFATISARTRTLREKIRRGSDAAAKGDTMDMIPLQAEIDSLCRMIKKLPASDSKALQGELVSMVDELSNLSDKLNQGLEVIRGELQGLSERQRAVSAYGKQP